LAGPGIVNFAFSRHIIEENAVTIAEFFEAPANSDFSRVLILEFLNRQFDNFCDRLGFRLVDPDVSGSTRAAITTLATSEFESVLIPGFVASLLGHHCLKVVLTLDRVVGRIVATSPDISSMTSRPATRSQFVAGTAQTLTCYETLCKVTIPLGATEVPA
jgi:hypothetical protein